MSSSRNRVIYARTQRSGGTTTTDGSKQHTALGSTDTTHTEKTAASATSQSQRSFRRSLQRRRERTRTRKTYHLRDRHNVYNETRFIMHAHRVLRDIRQTPAYRTLSSRHQDVARVDGRRSSKHTHAHTTTQPDEPTSLTESGRGSCTVHSVFFFASAPLPPPLPTSSPISSSSSSPPPLCLHPSA